jgi:hypothetical protein
LKFPFFFELVHGWGIDLSLTMYMGTTFKVQYSKNIYRNQSLSNFMELSLFGKILFFLDCDLWEKYTIFLNHSILWLLFYVLYLLKNRNKIVLLKVTNVTNKWFCSKSI